MKATVLLTFLLLSFCASALTIRATSSPILADKSVHITSSPIIADKSVHITGSPIIADLSVYISSSLMFADDEVCVSDSMSNEEAVAAYAAFNLWTQKVKLVHTIQLTHGGIDLCVTVFEKCH